jgi:glucans biosynthesis protein
MAYDGYRSIRFRPERSLWRGGPGQFEVQLFHPGFFFQEGVEVSVLGARGPEPVAFSSDLFSYDRVPAPPRDARLAFTGFRLHAPLNSQSYKDELVVFQGASYFRPLGKDTVYGLSARGLAIDFAEPTPEEFPRFSEFVLIRPGEADDHVWVLALLESRRATGAYAFRIQPGDLTRVEVTAEVFLREDVAVLGIAPLTSMYLFGEEGPSRFGDFRPEVHDSDGLSVLAENGEWLYRPLRNPKRTTVSSLRFDRPRGFGLVQRDRSFASYQDLEARYHDRPNAWIEPLSGFAQGSVRLLEIATELETDDNIAIAFVPEAPARRLAVSYRLHVGAGVPLAPPAGHVIATRMAKTKNGTRFLVDFAGNGLGKREGVEAVISVQNGRILEQHIEHNPFADGFRASFEVQHEQGKNDVELRAFLRNKGDVLSETWSYLWQPTG